MRSGGLAIRCVFKYSTSRIFNCGNNFLFLVIRSKETARSMLRFTGKSTFQLNSFFLFEEKNKYKTQGDQNMGDGGS